jgi:hypothetical protein
MPDLLSYIKEMNARVPATWGTTFQDMPWLDPSQQNWLQTYVAPMFPAPGTQGKGGSQPGQMQPDYGIDYNQVYSSPKGGRIPAMGPEFRIPRNVGPGAER